MPGMPDIRPALAVRARAAMVRSGAGYVKLGQLLSTRPDLIGEGAAREFAVLQRDVPPHDHGEMAAIALAEASPLLRRVGAPLACGSIGQVYRAVDAHERPVVVKVLRPGVYAAATAAMDDVARVLPFRAVRDAIADYRAVMAREVDLHREAAALRVFFREHTGIRIPEVYKCTENALVMEYVPSAPLCPSKPSHAVAARALVVDLLRLFCVEGVLHTDLHAGNYGFCEESGAPVLYDFGSVIRLPPAAARKVVFGVLYRDLGALVDGVVEAGLFREEPSVGVLRFCDQLISFGDDGELADVLRAGAGVPPTTDVGFSTFRALTTLDAVMGAFGVDVQEVAPAIMRDVALDADWLLLLSGRYRPRNLSRALRSS